MAEEIEDLFPASSSDPTPAATPGKGSVQEPSEVVVPEVVDQPAEQVKTAPEDHSPLGPSHYTMWAGCPCHEGKPGQNEFAARGSASHEILAMKTNGIEAPRPESMPLEDYENAEWGHQALVRISNGAHIVTEGKVTFNPPEDDDDGVLSVFKGVFGTVDAWWVDPQTGSLNIADYKTFDRGETDHTPQLSGYAVLLCSNHPEFCELPIRLHVLCGGIHKVVTYETDLMTAIDLTKGIIEKHLDPKAEPCPCDVCKYCAKIQTCKGIDRAVATVQNKPVWNGLSLAAKKIVVDSLKKIIENFETEFDEEIEKHNGVLEDKEHGIKWVRQYKKPSAVCLDIAALGEDLANNHGIAPETFINHILTVSKKKVTEALLKAHSGWKKGDCETVLDQHWAVPPSGHGAKFYKQVS